MALKALMLRKKIDAKKAELEQLRSGVNFETREAELRQAIEETTTEEERSAVDAELEAFETEKAELAEKETTLTDEIRALEEDLAEEEEKNKVTEPEPTPEPDKDERKDNHIMETRQFFGMNMQERDAFFAREDVKEFLQRARELGTQKRAVSGSDLLIPEVVLPLIHSVTEKYSKLLSKVHLVNLRGTARQVVMGELPEAVWTEMTAKLNEVEISFTEVELDGFKVGAYIPVSNSILEDSDIALASEIIEALGQAIGYAVDKAIVYGDGTKKPTGVASGITSKIDISSKSGAKFFAEILKGVAALKHASGNMTYVMNSATKAALMAEAVTINVNGAVVAGVNETMPITGGDIITLDFVPDNEIIAGYFDRYLLGRRAEVKIAQSSEYLFVEDQTVFKATARYDGKPVFADAFLAFGLAGAPTAAIDHAHDFAADTAN